MRIDELDYEFPPGSVAWSPIVKPWPEKGVDATARCFRVCGPPSTEELVEFGDELTADPRVNSVELNPNAQTPPRIDVIVRVADPNTWQTEAEPNPTDPNGEPVSLITFIMHGLKTIAEQYKEN